MTYHKPRTQPARPPLRYYGGGWTRAPWIVSHMPPHTNYLEPCFGGGSVLLRKPQVALETVNDLDGRVVNFFRVLRERPADLVELINLTPWAEDEMRAAFIVADDDPLEDARRFFALCWMTFFGGPTGQGHSMRYQKSITARYTSPPLDAIGRSDLIQTAARLKNVQVLNRDALELIDKFKKQEVLIYFDPPYLHETRRRKSGYNHEPDDQFHIDAAELLRQAAGNQAQVIVSGYPSTLYQKIYEAHGWRRIERSQRTNGQGERTECIWPSPNILLQGQLLKDLEEKS